MRFSLFLLAGLSLGSFTAQTAWPAEWSAKEFQVVAREPAPEEIELVPEAPSLFDQLFFQEELTSPGAVSNHPGAVAEQAEGWLNELGGLYRRVDHLPPPLGPVVEVDGTRMYRVYVFPYPGSRTRSGKGQNAGGSYETNTCMDNNKIPWLSVNYDINQGQMPKQKYWTIGHELMHALMFGDRILDQCNRNSFEVSEGIPDGAALYLINRKYPGFSGRVNYSGSAVGLRSYRAPFFIFQDVPESEKARFEKIMGYGTSSFWRFIAERFGGLKVFPHFLASPIKRGARHKDMYKWLDERLQTLEGLKPTDQVDKFQPENKSPGMYEVFPAFISEFASYGGSRYLKFDWRHYRSIEQARNVWLIRTLGGCERLVLTPESKLQEIPIDIHMNAAKCIHVRYEGFSGNVTSNIEILDDNLNLLDQLHLGWAWKIGPKEQENCYEKRKALNSKWPPCTYKSFSQTGPQVGKYARTWPVEAMDFGDQGGGVAERIFILSNVAVKPWLTQEVRNLKVKIGVCTSTANGKPAEPICQMQVPRKKQKPVNPAKPIGKEELYGLKTDPPAPDTAVKGLRLGPYTANRTKGAKAVSGGYGIAFHKLEYGHTGAVTGIVTLESDGIKTGSAVVASNLCKDPTKPIGEVIQSDEDALRISLDADLCEASSGNLKQCENGCPVVDHLTAEVNIAFGWRQFSETAPTDIRTPGIERYINTMPDSLQKAMNFGANTALPDNDDLSGNGDTGVGAGGDPGSSAGELEPCACTCEELSAAEARGEELRVRIDAGENPSMAGLGNLTRCSVPCQREYMICRMEADEAEKQKQEMLRKQKTEALDCDCSCQALDDRYKRAQDLEKNYISGDTVSNEVIFELSQCASMCQQEMIGCAMKNRH